MTQAVETHSVKVVIETPSAKEMMLVSNSGRRVAQSRGMIAGKG